MTARRRWIAAAAALALGLQALLAPAHALAAIGAFGPGGIDPDGICFAPGDRDRAPSPAGPTHGHACILCPALDGPTALLPPGGTLQLPPTGTAGVIGPADAAVIIAAGFRPPTRAPPLA